MSQFRPLFPLLFCLLDPAAAVETGTLRVTQHANTNAALSAAAPGISVVKGPGGTTGGTILPGTNRADYEMDFLSGRDSEMGLLLSSVAQLSRDDSAAGGPAPGPFHATSSFGINATTGDYWIAVHWAEVGDNLEANSDVSYAFLPYDRFLGGFASNSVNNGPLTGFTGSPGIALGVHLTDPTDTAGRYLLDLTSFAPEASQNGVLLVTGAKNEDNYALSRAHANGTFELFCHDNAVNGARYENDGVGFVYLPVSSVGRDRVAALGRVNGDGSTDVSGGNFTVTKGGTGQWFLSIPGHGESTGTLIVSPEGGDDHNVDNIVSFAWNAAAGHWTIESRDLTGTEPQVPALQNMGRPDEDAFSFAFFTAAAAGTPPTATVTAPAADETKVSVPARLALTATDADGDPLTVSFHGRRVGRVGGDFTVVALPDTQFYSENRGGNRARIFAAQTDWIVQQRTARDIGFVLHLGDITQFGDSPATAAAEWQNAADAMYRLENPATTGLADGIPYVLAVGNHDQSPMGNADGTTNGFNTKFGVDPITGRNHFEGKSYYGDTRIPGSADNYYALITAGGMDFIVISLEYDTTPDREVLDWADALLKSHPARRGIVITHYLVRTGNPAPFGVQGQAVLDALGGNPNLIFMHGGHISGEGRRTDQRGGKPVHSLLADYQSRSNGGDGWLRLLRFRPELDRIDISTYSPVLDAFESDADSSFSIPVDLRRGMGPFTEIATVRGPDGSFGVDWQELEPGTRYEWYATVSDGVSTVETPVRSFVTAGAPLAPAVEITAPAEGKTFTAGSPVGLSTTAADPDGSVAKIEYYDGSTKIGEAVAPPFTFTWSAPPAGLRTITALATDDEGNTTTSLPVRFRIVALPGVPQEAAISTGLFRPGWVVQAGSPAPRGFVSPGTNVGDIPLRPGGSTFPFTAGVVAASNWQSPLDPTSDSSNNLVSPYADASGNSWINVYDQSGPNEADSNPSTSEEFAGVAAAIFPYSDGWTGASVSADGNILGSRLPAGADVQRIGDGLYVLHGIPESGNLLAFPNGNSGTDADNVLSVRLSEGRWLVSVRDNSSDEQNGSFTFLHVPTAAPGVFSGLIRSGGSVTPLNAALTDLGATVSREADHFLLTIGDGTRIHPGNAAIFLTGDTTQGSAAADNVISWTAAGNAFRIFSQDLPELTGAFQATDLRFVVVPFDAVPPQAEAPPTVGVSASDDRGGEYGPDRTVAFTFRRSGSVGSPLEVAFGTGGSARPRSDFTAASGRRTIPAGESEATVGLTVLADDEVEGEESIRIDLIASAHYTLGENSSATAWIDDRPLHAFLHAAGIGSAEGDDDGDGRINLLEYFHGSDPTTADAGAALAAGTVVDGSFTVSFKRSVTARDVSAEILWSTDMVRWFRSAESDGTRSAAISLRTTSPAGETPEQVEATWTIASGDAPDRVFLKLEVTP